MKENEANDTREILEHSDIIELLWWNIFNKLEENVPKSWGNAS